MPADCNPGEQPRLLEFDGIDIETPLEGNLLVCRNLDVPGVSEGSARFWRARRQHRNFALGRERSGVKPVKALAVVQVDAPVSETVLEALATIEALLEARPVSLPEGKFEGIIQENRLGANEKPPPQRGFHVSSKWLLAPAESAITPECQASAQV